MNPRFLTSKPEFFPVPIPGTITATVTPKTKGRISFQGSFYPAQIHDPTHNDPLPPGTPVQVIGRIGITLLITRA
ncbi:NfeD family protein [Spirulina sp. CCNP1310]|uniref:NfeD family protein n=1 Tax=Spirulina sp. CCNP1310 TaxID=3110249 RepID=UPI002B2029CC|nr:NfeD family protein [Spirulina sp. CCNP1310]MEA5418718.1 NfeD family protein [Spirulina sp. CCNP1310]